jgi:hypothetical protein
MTIKQFDELAPEHKVMAELRNSQAEIMSEYKLLEARVCLTDLLIHCINSDYDAELYKQFQSGFLTTTQFVDQIGESNADQTYVTDTDRYCMLKAFVNLNECQAAHTITGA